MPVNTSYITASSVWNKNIPWYGKVRKEQLINKELSVSILVPIKLKMKSQPAYFMPFSFLAVEPSYSLSDFLIESVSVRKQLEQETLRHEYEASSNASSSFPPPPLPTKHQLISCLATRGHWVTTQPNLQLDPPDSQQLLLKGASLHFLFEPVWLLSGAHQGDFLHMLKNVLAKLEDNTFK